MVQNFAIYPNQLFSLDYYDSPTHFFLIIHPKFFKKQFTWVKLVYTYACVLYYKDYIKNSGKHKLTIVNPDNKFNIDDWKYITKCLYHGFLKGKKKYIHGRFNRFLPKVDKELVRCGNKILKIIMK